MCLSVPQIAAAATRIKTSSGPGVGTGQSRISVPAAPSTGEDLTTACMASGGGCYHVTHPASHQTERAGAWWNVDWFYRARQFLSESADRVEHSCRVAFPQILVQTTVHAKNLLR